MIYAISVVAAGLQPVVWLFTFLGATGLIIDTRVITAPNRRRQAVLALSLAGFLIWAGLEFLHLRLNGNVIDTEDIILASLLGATKHILLPIAAILLLWRMGALKPKGRFWTRPSVIALLIGLTLLMIGLRFAIGSLIPD